MEITANLRLRNRDNKILRYHRSRNVSNRPIVTYLSLQASLFHYQPSWRSQTSLREIASVLRTCQYRVVIDCHSTVMDSNLFKATGWGIVEHRDCAVWTLWRPRWQYSTKNSRGDALRRKLSADVSPIYRKARHGVTERWDTWLPRCYRSQRPKLCLSVRTNLNCILHPC